MSSAPDQTTVPEPAAPEVVAAAEESAAPGAGGVATRVCGRCQRTFTVDAGQPTVEEARWWACPPCHETLLGPSVLAMPTWPPRPAP